MPTGTGAAIAVLPPRSSASRAGGALADEDGQALIEAAFVLPAAIFLLLCALQLTQLQQARLMVEYAAFCAARVGVVRDMDNGRGARGEDGPLHDAAVLAVLPTFGRTDSAAALARTRLRFEAEDALLRPVGLAQVRVAVLNPRRADFAAYGGHLNGQEIDFDDVRPAAAKATLLSLQVRYLYELKIPFAGQAIQALWLAARARRLPWAGLSAAGVLEDGLPGGLDLTALSLLARRGRFFLPVHAWHTMRMQSNPFLRWAAP
ncbi:MAG: hypothetical protein NVS2B9_13000 [Myxococcales bacterium]